MVHLSEPDIIILRICFWNFKCTCKGSLYLKSIFWPASVSYVLFTVNYSTVDIHIKCISEKSICTKTRRSCFLSASVSWHCCLQFKSWMSFVCIYLHSSSVHFIQQKNCVFTSSWAARGERGWGFDCLHSGPVQLFPPERIWLLSFPAPQRSYSSPTAMTTVSSSQRK